MRSTTAPLRKSYLRLFDLAKAFKFVKTPSSADLNRTVKDLRRVQGSALIIGGIAVAHYGQERTTEDIDLLYANRDVSILERLGKYFKVVRSASNGWHELRHKTTGIRLKLIPDGGLGQYGFIPFCEAVGGSDGYISLLGLIWLKLIAGRPRDEIDVIELLKRNLKEAPKLRSELPAELQGRFDASLAKAHTDLDNDPYLHPEKFMKRKLQDGTIIDL